MNQSPFENIVSGLRRLSTIIYEIHFIRFLSEFKDGKFLKYTLLNKISNIGGLKWGKLFSVQRFSAIVTV